MSLKSSSFIHVRENKPIALIHVREKKPFALIHGREKKSWYSSMGGKGYCHGCTDQKAVTEVEPTSNGFWRRGRTNTLKIKGKLFPC